MRQVFDRKGREKKANSWEELAFLIFIKSIFCLNLHRSKWDLIGNICDRQLHQPQLPELQEPELHPPPELIGLTDVMPKPERGPAST